MTVKEFGERYDMRINPVPMTGGLFRVDIRKGERIPPSILSLADVVVSSVQDRAVFLTVPGQFDKTGRAIQYGDSVRWGGREGVVVAVYHDLVMVHRSGERSADPMHGSWLTVED